MTFATVRGADSSDRKVAIRQAILGGPILPTILRLALPTIVVLIAQTAVGVAETYYVSSLGTQALVGVTLVFPIWVLMGMMSAGGIGGGVAAAVSRAVGANRHEDATALVWHSLVLAILFGAVFTALMFLLGTKLYQSLGADGGSLAAALLYSRYIFLAAIPIWIVNLMSAALRGVGNVRTPAFVTLGGAIVLIPLSPVFIFGIGPLPGLGLAGAGVAVTIYYSVAAAYLIDYLAKGKSGLQLKVSLLTRAHFRAILGVGLVSALSTVQLNLTVILVTGAVGRFGSDALAGYGMAARLDYVLVPMLFGFGTAMVTMIGTNVGAGNAARAKHIIWVGAGVGAGIMELIGVSAALFPQVWIGIFTRDASVLEAGAAYLRIVGPFYGAVGLTFLLFFASQGSGRPIWPFFGGTVRLAISAGLGWILVSAFAASMMALFAAIAFGAVAAAAICVGATLTGATFRAEPKLAGTRLA
jgi:putative MATE family efflux protein